MTVRLLLAALFAAPASAAPATPASIGTAAIVRGVVRAFPSTPQAPGRIVGSGQPVHLGERIVTNDLGRLQVLLLDGSHFTIGPNTSIVLDRFVYDPSKGTGELSAEAAKGVFRYISGKIARADPKAVRLKLPVGTLGIEGTELLARISPEGRTELMLRSGRARLDTGAGSFEIRRPGDAMVVEPGAAPRPPRPADADLQKAFKDAFSPAAFSALTSPEAAAAALARLGGSLSLPEAADAAFGAGSAAWAASELASYLFPTGGESAGAGLSNWEELKRIPNGTARFAGTAAFTQTTTAGGAACLVGCVGTWTFDHTVDFGARTITASQSISAGAIADAVAGTSSFDALTGNALYVRSSAGGGTYTYQLVNADGQTAKQLVGGAAYRSGAVTGAGTPITAIRNP